MVRIGSASYRLHHLGIAEEVEGKCGILSGAHGKASVQVCDCTAAGGHNHSDAYEGFPRGGVLYRARYVVLRKRSHREQAQ